MSQDSGPFILMWKPNVPTQESWSQWAKEHNVKLMAPQELHMTSFYAKDESADTKWPAPMQASFTVKPNGIGKLGKAVVVFFDTPQFVTNRFSQLQTEYKHSFPTFIPHMSLFYDEGFDYDNLTNLITTQMPNITFMREVIDEIKDMSDAAREFLDTCGLWEDTSTLIPNQPEGAFYQGLLEKFPDSGIAEAHSGGDVDAYKTAWAKFIDGIPFTKKAKSDGKA